MVCDALAEEILEILQDFASKAREFVDWGGLVGRCHAKKAKGGSTWTDDPEIA